MPNIKAKTMPTLPQSTADNYFEQSEIYICTEYFLPAGWQSFRIITNYYNYVCFKGAIITFL